MFDIGFAELMLVGLIALLVLGPERLPKAARTVGYWGGRARAYMRQMTTELEREVQQSEIRETIQKTRDTLNAKVDLDTTMTATTARPAQPAPPAGAEEKPENEATLSAWERAEMEVQGTGPKLGEDLPLSSGTSTPEPGAGQMTVVADEPVAPSADGPAPESGETPADKAPKAHG